PGRGGWVAWRAAGGRRWRSRGAGAFGRGVPLDRGASVLDAAAVCGAGGGGVAARACGGAGGGAGGAAVLRAAGGHQLELCRAAVRERAWGDAGAEGVAVPAAALE